VNELQRGKKRIGILIVEDDAEAGDIASRLMALEFPDATLYSAADGVIGLESFKEHRPDIVITDVGMPRLGGVEMARAIKAIRPQTKFVVVSAHNEGTLLDQFKQMGIDIYLLKPLNFDLLVAAIKRCIEEIGSGAGE
jgi:YesN/AraC family two-component response regulator